MGNCSFTSLVNIESVYCFAVSDAFRLVLMSVACHE